MSGDYDPLGYGNVKLGSGDTDAAADASPADVSSAEASADDVLFAVPETAPDSGQVFGTDSPQFSDEAVTEFGHTSVDDPITAEAEALPGVELAAAAPTAEPEATSRPSRTRDAKAVRRRPSVAERDAASGDSGAAAAPRRARPVPSRRAAMPVPRRKSASWVPVAVGLAGAGAGAALMLTNGGVVFGGIAIGLGAVGALLSHVLLKP